MFVHKVLDPVRRYGFSFFSWASVIINRRAVLYESDPVKKKENRHFELNERNKKGAKV